MSEEIGFRSQLTPDLLLSGDASVCGGPVSMCTVQAIWRIASLAAGMLRVGTRAVVVQTGTPPLHPDRIVGSHFGPPWGSWWLGAGRCCNTGRRRLSTGVGYFAQGDGGMLGTGQIGSSIPSTSDARFHVNVRVEAMRRVLTPTNTV
jgi:hypothetical protein